MFILGLIGTSYFCTYYAIRLRRLGRSRFLPYSPVIRDVRFAIPLEDAYNDYFPGNKKKIIEKFGNYNIYVLNFEDPEVEMFILRFGKSENRDIPN